ncbi:metallophosphoesterase family protein [uncultured Nevskia sp.]|uniref:metallophosphoesterase family protein n=1 Tax=uncultured Nevskia sp. TaxID=228950 RepID=UPI0025D07619|nr:metallophosphoesterase family protein [uncultured Nevskia sp.]
MIRPPAVIGLISDTHGLLRERALAALAGVDAILHAGDIGDAAILEQLATIAPVTAVRGNNDREPAFEAVPETATLQVGAVAIHLLHDLKLLLADDAAAAQVIVSGHSHRPLIEPRDGRLYVNPGSAGPRRFSLPVTVAKLRIAADGSVQAELIELQL